MLGLEILKVRPYVMNSVFVFPIHVIRKTNTQIGKTSTHYF